MQTDLQNDSSIYENEMHKIAIPQKNKNPAAKQESQSLPV